MKEAADNRELLFSLVLHDLRGPAQNIKLAAELLMQQELTVAGKQKFLNMIRTGSNKHFTLVEKLNVWCKGGLNPEGESMEVQVKDIVSGLINYYKPQLDRKSIKVIDNTEEKTRIVSCDR